jgi:mannose-6-phosphate isomerase-like protein (cupin superfamily)
MTNDADEYRLIAEAMRDIVAGFGGDEANHFLRDWPDHPRRRDVTTTYLPVSAQLVHLKRCAIPDVAVLVDRFLEIAPHCNWRQTYSTDDLGTEFLKNYGWVEIIGERGALASHEIAAGFLMLGANTAYPLHAHDAEELYFPLVGHAEWARGNEAYSVKPPGTMIYHPSRVPHAMRTHAEPLLAFYVWRDGDLTQKSDLVAN